jgi:beta-N-acetylhexosaminidase
MTMKSPLMIGLPGLYLSAEDEARLAEIQPRGVVLFTRNFASVSQIKDLIKSVKSIAGDDITVAVDHEGGPVVRFPEALPELPAPRLLGEDGDANNVRNLARVAAEALADWGITLNLAPVVDILTPHSHSIMADRCFGSDPELVAELSIAFIEGMHDAGIQCTAKHFPGIGPAAQDTHEKKSIVTDNREQLETLWYPFKSAVNAGVDAVMTTHATYSSLDADHPATFSAGIIKGILRQDLGFSGFILSDDLEMGAIIDNYSIEEATRNCLHAGCDMALVCRTIEHQIRAFRALDRE